jgi:hypothetical protein
VTKLKFDIDDSLFDVPEPVEPEGGWKKACTVADHKWALEIEEGRAQMVCLDPHPESFAAEVDPVRGSPVCLMPYWESDDIGTVNPIPVKFEHVDDSTPSTPNGPAEYGFYMTIEKIDLDV